MSNLETMIAKILADAKDEAESIISEATTESKTLVDQKVESANELRNSMVTRAKKESSQIQERVIASVQLKTRDSILAAKQEVMENVFEKAKEKVKDMEEGKFTAFLKDTIGKIKLSGDEKVFVPNKYKGAVEALNLPATIEVDDNIQSGFIISSKSTYYNYTFEDLIEFNRDDLESGIASRLFSE